MKSERRHELQTNELADWLGNHIEAYRPYLKTTGAVLLALAAVGLAYVIVSQRQEAASGQSWEAYFRAIWQRDPKEIGARLEQVAKQEANSLPGLWARQSAADVDLENGAQKLFRDRAEALRELERAEENYLLVEKQAQAYPQLLERCRYGLAQALECQGKLEKAREKYEQVVKADATGALGKMAARRLKSIGGDQVAEFYDWFARQTPPPPGQPRGTGLPPLDLENLPDRPDLSLGGDKLFGGETKKPASEEKPEGDEGGKPEDKPAEDKPEDKPAAPTDEKPSDKPSDKPADAPQEKPADKPATEPKDSPTEKPSDKPSEKPEQ